MYSLKELQDKVIKKINELSFNKAPSELYEPIGYTLHSGGKRIRPALVLAACNLFSDDVDAAMQSALGFEVFHNFTLIHDDIMDNSDKRRNRPSVHKKWDVNTAILSGDAMVIEAYKLIAKTPANALPKVLQLFNKTAMEVCEGQQYDMNFETENEVTIEEYLKMIRLKTAVLIAGGLKTGALLANSDSSDADLLYEFGINLGLAFQLQDDLLDVYADEKTFGKPVGGDIAEGKKTFLFLSSLEKANDTDKKRLQSLFFDNEIERTTKINGVTNLYNKYNIRKLTLKHISEYYKKALSALAEINVPKERKEVLYSFSDMIMKRDK